MRVCEEVIHKMQIFKVALLHFFPFKYNQVYEVI